MRMEPAQLTGDDAQCLDGVGVEFTRHSFTVMLRPSGSDKGTLFHCAGGLECPTPGTVWPGRSGGGRPCGALLHG